MRTRTLIFATALALTACKPAPQEPDSTAPTPEGTTATAVASPDDTGSGPDTGESGALSAIEDVRDATPVKASIVDVQLSNKGNTENSIIGASTTNFAPTDVVYAEVLSEGSADSYTLYAKWIASDGTVLADYGTAIKKKGTQRTVISLSKPDGWPAGENKIELAINSNPARTVVFRVSM